MKLKLAEEAGEERQARKFRSSTDGPKAAEYLADLKERVYKTQDKVGGRDEIPVYRKGINVRVNHYKTRQSAIQNSLVTKDSLDVRKPPCTISSPCFWLWSKFTRFPFLHWQTEVQFEVRLDLRRKVWKVKTGRASLSASDAPGGYWWNWKKLERHTFHLALIKNKRILDCFILMNGCGVNQVFQQYHKISFVSNKRNDNERRWTLRLKKR